MADIAPERAKVVELLDGLFKSPDGRIVLANMHAALGLNYLDCKQCLALLLKCVEGLDSATEFDGDNAWRTFAETAEKHFQTFYFRRVPAFNDLSATIVVVLDHTMFFMDENNANRFTLLKKEKLPEVILLGFDGPTLRSLERQRIFARRVLNRPGYLGASLGSGAKVVWATRSDSAWEKLAEVCARTGNADAVRDQLGLLKAEGLACFELRVSVPLQKLRDQHSIKMAAPSFVEGTRHRRFRQKSDEVSTDRWGRTVNLFAFSRKQKPADGMPEIVLDRLPLANLEGQAEWRPLGNIQTKPPGTDDDFIELLYEGKTVDRIRSLLIKSLLGP